MSAIPLGAFDVFERIGVGGMGAVYRAQHRLTKTDVAVKVIRGEPDHRTVRRFHREVQAHAGLLHPSIVQLLEYGDVDDFAASKSNGVLAAGSPFVGMELAHGGTVRDVQVASWDVLRRILVQVLDALAHAHARNVIHRDLKPGNLLAFDENGELRVKLTDFGIAHALASITDRGTTSLRTITGTPKYMPPEQLLGRWREHGPWTDIYALGCVAFELASGQAPFVGSAGVRDAVRRLNESPPDLVSLFQVPDELETWLKTALANHPADRFQRANEALEALPAVDELPSETLPSRTGAKTTLRYPQPEAGTSEDTLTLTTEATGSYEETVLQRVGHRERTLPSPPVHWRKSENETSTTLVGAGFGLIGLRRPAYVGRIAERTEIWDAFLRTVDEQHVEVVLLEGEAGIGKTSLSQWAVSRAHEVGSAQLLQIGDITRDVEGLETALRTWMLPRRQVHEHLLRSLPALNEDDDLRAIDARALTELLRPTPSGMSGTDGPPYNFSSPREKLLLIERLVRRFVRRQPTIVWIDDLQWAGQAMNLVEHLVSCDPSPAALVLATTRSDVVAERPRLRERLRQLDEADCVRRLSLGPLPAAETRSLIKQLVSLPPDATDLLTERMEGNPLFGVQLLTDWVERGLIQADGDGVALDASAAHELPKDVHDVWLARIRRLVSRFDDPANVRTSLELAATLGKDVRSRDWETVCAQTSAMRDLWPEVVARGLARTTEEGWSFAHGLLVDSLRRLAREAGRWAEHNRSCASALETAFAEKPLAVGRRLADHWIAAGELERALDPLVEEADRLRRTDDHEASREVVRLSTELLDRLKAPPNDPRRLRAEVEYLRDALRLGESAANTLTALLLILDRASLEDTPVVESKAMRVGAMCYAADGDIAEARRYAERAVKAALRSGDMRETTMALLRITKLEVWGGGVSDLTPRVEQLRKAAADSGDPFLMIRADHAAAWAFLTAKDWASAEGLFRDALERSRSMGYRMLEAESLNSIGEVARATQRLGLARYCYREAVDVFHQMQQRDDVAISQANLAFVELEARNFAEARPLLETAARTFEEQGTPVYRRVINLGRLVIAAGTEQWAAFDLLMGELEDGWPDGAQLEPDHPWLLELASTIAEETGEPQRSAGAATLASTLRERLEPR